MFHPIQTSQKYVKTIKNSQTRQCSGASLGLFGFDEEEHRGTYWDHLFGPLKKLVIFGHFGQASPCHGGGYRAGQRLLFYLGFGAGALCRTRRSWGRRFGVFLHSKPEKSSPQVPHPTSTWNTDKVPVDDNLVYYYGILLCYGNIIWPIFEGSLEVKLPTIWRDEKQSREEA